MPSQGFSPQQPGQYGQPGPYGQQPYGQFDGNQDYPGGQAPKKKTGLIVGLVLLGVLIIGGVVTLILVLTSSDDNTASGSGGSGGAAEEAGQSTPQALANYLLQSYVASDVAKLKKVLCSGVHFDPDSLPPNTTGSLNGPATETGVDFTLQTPSIPPTKLTATFRKEGGSYCWVESHKADN
jgi:hypothetical protein